MRIRTLNKAAFSLLEILLASVIFVISVAGVFFTLHAVRAPVTNKEDALVASVFGKQVLEALYSQVNAATYYNSSCAIPNGDGSCGDFSLLLGTHEVASSNLPSGLSWPSVLTSSNTSLSYVVSCGDGIAPSGTPLACSGPTVARRVDLNVNWPNVS